MARFQAELGVVDRLRGLPLPEHLECTLMILACDPGHNGDDFQDADIISSGSPLVSLRREHGRLRNSASVTVPLHPGYWPSGVLCIVDAAGDIIARGGIRPYGGGGLTGAAVAGVDDVLLRENRQI